MCGSRLKRSLYRYGYPSASSYIFSCSHLLPELQLLGNRAPVVVVGRIMVMPTTYVYCAACPYAEQCSDTAWKRAAVWGWDECECKLRLKQHLGTSGKHSSLDEDDVLLAVETAEYIVEPWQEPQPSKKRRTEGAPPAAGSVDAASIASAVVEAVAKASSSSGGIANPSSASSAILPMSASPGDSVLVPRQLLSAAVDALGRAQTSSRSAQRLLEAGITTFGNEAQVFHEVKTTLASLLDRR